MIIGVGIPVTQMVLRMCAHHLLVVKFGLTHLDLEYIVQGDL